MGGRRVRNAQMGVRFPSSPLVLLPVVPNSRNHGHLHFWDAPGTAGL